MNVEDDAKPWGDKWRAGTSNFRSVCDLYTKRNLWAIAAVFDAINKLESKEIADALAFSLTAISLGLSRMNRYMTGASFPFYLITGTYYTPQISCEEQIWKHLVNKVDRALLVLQVKKV